MLPHTRLGDISVGDENVQEVERNRRERIGLRGQEAAEERAVAVKRVSGWRIRRLALAVRVMVEAGGGAPEV